MQKIYKTFPNLLQNLIADGYDFWIIDGDGLYLGLGGIINGYQHKDSIVLSSEINVFFKAIGHEIGHAIDCKYDYKISNSEEFKKYFTKVSTHFTEYFQDPTEGLAELIGIYILHKTFPTITLQSDLFGEDYKEILEYIEKIINNYRSIHFFQRKVIKQPEDCTNLTDEQKQTLKCFSILSEDESFFSLSKAVDYINDYPYIRYPQEDCFYIIALQICLRYLEEYNGIIDGQETNAWYQITAEFGKKWGIDPNSQNRAQKLRTLILKILNFVNPKSPIPVKKGDSNN